MRGEIRGVGFSTGWTCLPQYAVRLGARSVPSERSSTAKIQSLSAQTMTGDLSHLRDEAHSRSSTRDTDAPATVLRLGDFVTRHLSGMPMPSRPVWQYTAAAAQ